MVGKARSRELCEALELVPPTLQADHLRFFTSNHSRPVAATINTTMMLHGVDEVGSSLGGVVGFDADAFFADGVDIGIACVASLSIACAISADASVSTLLLRHHSDKAWKCSLKPIELMTVRSRDSRNARLSFSNNPSILRTIPLNNEVCITPPFVILNVPGVVRKALSNRSTEVVMIPTCDLSSALRSS